jgi:hypothetical protein
MYHKALIGDVIQMTNPHKPHYGALLIVVDVTPFDSRVDRELTPPEFSTKAITTTLEQREDSFHTVTEVYFAKDDDFEVIGDARVTSFEHRCI